MSDKTDTMRDSFAAAAVTGFCADPYHRRKSARDLACDAYKIADLMLEEREKRQGGCTAESDSASGRNPDAHDAARGNASGQPFDSAPATPRPVLCAIEDRDATLTDDERDTVLWAIGWCEGLNKRRCATLRGLLERLGGEQ